MTDLETADWRDDPNIRPDAPVEDLPAWMPWERLPDLAGGARVFQNSRYTVSVRVCRAPPWGRVYRLGISNFDQSARHDWRDFQRIKNELIHPEAEAFELYPAESRLLDPSNHYVLWVIPRGQGRLSVGEPIRYVHGRASARAPQRAFPAGEEPADRIARIEVRVDRRTRRRGDSAKRVWRLWWRANGRKRTCERQAWTRAEALREAVHLRNRLNARGPALAWGDFTARYLEDHARWKKPSTVASTRSVLARLTRALSPERLDDLTPEALSRYLAGGLGAGLWYEFQPRPRRISSGPALPRAHMRTLRPVRPATINKHLRTLRAVFRWAVDERILDASPARNLKRLKEVHLDRVIYERRSQITRLANALHRDGPAWETAALLMADCGLRIGEVSHLSWTSVDLERGEVRIGRESDGWTPKGLSGRMALSRRLLGLMAGLRAAQPDGGRVLGEDNPDRFERSFRRRLRAACHRAGLPAILPHGLRRSFGTVLANEGMEAAQLQRVMRHGDVKTTLQFYARINERRAAKAAQERLESAL